MRPVLVPLVAVLLLAGCADAPDAATGWTFTQRSADVEPEPLGSADAFAVERTLEASADMRQIGGQWHGPVEGGEPFTLRFESDVPMLVAFRIESSGASSSGECDWGPDADEAKTVGLGSARMRSTDTTCEIVFTPGATLQAEEGPTLRWEARSNETQPAGWSLSFAASAGPASTA